MSEYQHVLLASDLGEDSLTIGHRAVAVAKANNAKLSILHVRDVVPIDMTNELIIPQLDEIEAQINRRATERLHALAHDLAIPEATLHNETGPTKSVIIDFANSNSVDLIVLGKHSRHGFSRLLGSTANAVLHHAPCDVLAVIVADD